MNTMIGDEMNLNHAAPANRKSIWLEAVKDHEHGRLYLRCVPLVAILTFGGLPGQARTLCDVGRDFDAKPIVGFFAHSDYKTEFRLGLGDAFDTCLLQHHDRSKISEVQLVDDEVQMVAESVSAVSKCRDATSQRDWVIALMHSGRYSDLGFWSVNTETLAVESEYLLDWIEVPKDTTLVQQLENTGIISAGMCRIREWLQSEEELGRAMSFLSRDSNPTIAKIQEESVRWGFRELQGPEVNSWLKVLISEASRGRKAPVIFERAQYADAKSQETWKVVQIYRTRLGEAEGVVLALDRRQNTWWTLYNVPSGYSYAMNFPMRNMVVRENKLRASICEYDCSQWGSYARFEIDLETGQSARLNGESRRDRPWHEMRNGNRIIHNLDSLLIPLDHQESLVLQQLGHTMELIAGIAPPGAPVMVCKSRAALIAHTEARLRNGPSHPLVDRGYGDANCRVEDLSDWKSVFLKYYPGELGITGRTLVVLGTLRDDGLGLHPIIRYAMKSDLDPDWMCDVSDMSALGTGCYGR
ncbi:MAG: hypothetical protein OXT70_12615 [Chloroflexota bacterium]|nr:hypothetical protein [Chloroflexota bacterium]